MKPNIFKIRRFHGSTQNRDEQVLLTPREKEEIAGHQVTKDCQDSMSKLMTMFQTFMKQSMNNPPKNAKKYQNQTITKTQLHYQPRDRHVIFNIPEFQGSSPNQKDIQIWITEVTNAAFSSSFNFFVNEEMTFEQAKVFCAETIFSNLIRFSQKYKLEQGHLEMIDRHLSENILPYLQRKYPLTASSDVNKALEKQLEQTNNLDLLENDFLVSHDIMFKYRSNQNYNDMIMKVLNKAMEVCDQTAPFAPANNAISNYQDFQTYISDLFEKVYNEEWVLGIHSKNHEKDHNLKVKQEQHKQKYRERVKQYTHYMIGRKISENTPQFTEQQISGQNLTIQSPAILRILTKWCEQLWTKFSKQSYFSERAEQVMLQDPTFINPFFKWMKTSIDKRMQTQKTKIEDFKKTLDGHCHYKESVALLKYIQEDDINYIEKYQKAYGRFSSHMVKNLHSYIIMYLNRIIHGLLTVSKQFFDQQIDKSWDDWPAPPNLMTFKIGDLIRCKCSSKQKEIIAIYKNILHISNNNPEKLKIVRIKNRLREGTNDILINVRYNEKIISQIQLEVISKSKTKFIQCSNSFCHFIYELQRSNFGPISQMCNVWNNFEPRSKTFQKIQKSINYDQIQTVDNIVCPLLGGHKFENYTLPFECSKCCQDYFHNNYIFPNIKCKNCLTYICVKCQIKQWKIDELKQKIFKKSKTKDLIENCNKVSEGKLPPLGVCVKIQSREIKIELFKYMKVESKFWLFGRKDNQQIYEIQKVNNKKQISAFMGDYCIFEVTGADNHIKISDKQALRFTVKHYLKECYKEQRQSLVLTQIRFSVEQMEDLISSDGARDVDRKRIRKIQFASNYMDIISYFLVFENLTAINLDYNNITSFKDISKFKMLQTLQMRQNKKLFKIGDQIGELQKLQTLKLRSCNINQVSPNIGNLKNINYLMFAQNKLSQLPETLSKLVNLKQLDCFANQLQKLPNLSTLVNLKKLQMDKNMLTQIPDWVTNLLNLSFLGFSHNKIEVVPNNIKNLQKLQRVELDHNKLKQIPEDSFQIESLRYINLSNNNLSQFNVNLIYCKNLDYLGIQTNSISVIHQSLGSCISLKYLYLHANPLVQIPSTISKLKKVDGRLNLSNTKITSIPKFIEQMEWIRQLNLQHNEISEISVNFSKLKLLQHINLNYNRIKDIAQLRELNKANVKVKFQYNQIEEIPQFIKQFPEASKPKGVSEMFKENNIKDISLPILQIMKDTLFFTNNKLTVMPIVTLVNKQIIKEMVFNNNQIKQIPRIIGQFKALIKLNLSTNLIKLIPKQLEQCTQMKQFCFSIFKNPLQVIECMKFVKNTMDDQSRGIVYDIIQGKTVIEQ